MRAPKPTTPPTTERKGFIINWEIVGTKVDRIDFSFAQASHNVSDSQNLLASQKRKELQDAFHQEHEPEYYSEDRAHQQ